MARRSPAIAAWFRPKIPVANGGRLSVPHRCLVESALDQFTRFLYRPSQFAGSANEKSHPIINILGSFPSESWSVSAAKSTRPRGGADVVI